MSIDRGLSYPNPDWTCDDADARLTRGTPDPDGLAIARQMQERLKPAKVILLGSRAVGEHLHDSDVDLMAVAADEAGVKEADDILRHLLEGKYDVPVVNVTTITLEEFHRKAPLAQSWAGQAARHGVTPEGRSLGYRPERDPTAEEIREAAVWWLTLADIHLEGFARLAEYRPDTASFILGFEAQLALERAFKGLLTAGNDDIRFRRDAAMMWRHVEGAKPIADRDGAKAMEELLKGTTGPDGRRCHLTEISEAHRRGDIEPDLSDSDLEAMKRYLVPAVNALITEALARCGATKEDLQKEKARRRGLG